MKENQMKHRITAAAFSAALLAPGLIASPATADETCRPGAQVREMVADFVASIQDDVQSDRARAATRLALVESLRTYRGARADNAQERRELGQQISALARQQSNADTRLGGKALSAAILALTEQRERGGTFNAEERQELRGAIAGLKRAIVNRADTAAEGEQLAAAIRDIVQQFPCKPA
jgi:hypothetical protein